MKKIVVSLSLVVAVLTGVTLAEDNDHHHRHIKRVLLISVDGMHAVDFANCAKGISSPIMVTPIVRRLRLSPGMASIMLMQILPSHRTLSRD
jgi:DNA mismatch repair protein MutH